MYLRNRFFYILFILAAVSTLGLIADVFLIVAKIGIAAFALASVADIIILLITKLKGERIIAQKLDLGETNPVRLDITVVRGWVKQAYYIDELPTEFYCTDDSKPLNITKKDSYQENKNLFLTAEYTLYPCQRGEYHLGRLLVFATFLGLVERRFTIEKKGRAIDVYPAFSRLREKDQQVRSYRDITTGVHKRQQPANQTEFKDIREYVPGDDIRTVNWKATARAGKTMVNNYEDERSQHVINIIDCGRPMHRTFNNLTLQDYAINASLLLTYSALSIEGDSVGLITYGPSATDYLPSRPGKKQLNTVMRHLYALRTDYGEGDLEELCLLIDRNVQRRSLMVLHTDYTHIAALERHISYLQRISRRHNLVVVIYLDNELKSVSERKYGASEGNKNKATQSSTYYVESSIASGLMLQKQAIVDRLQQNGINCILTPPENVSFAVLRKYIELKARNAW